MIAPRPRAFVGPMLAIATAFAACSPGRFRPEPIDYSLPTANVTTADSGAAAGVPGSPSSDIGAASQRRKQQPKAPTGPLQLGTVIESVTNRYPPLLMSLLERDLASGRLQQAMGGFDARISAKVGGRLQGFYESTVASGLLEQPLATGDTIYGGYRVSDRFLPDYYRDRTQDDGEFVFGGRMPLLQNRATDPRRTAVRKAQIGVDLAEPKILGARIEYVRRSTRAYYKWVAAGKELKVARELQQLALQRHDGLKKAVERQFLAPVALTDNERLIKQRGIYVARAERSLQQASLILSLYLRDADDLPLVPQEDNLPEDLESPQDVTTSIAKDLDVAARQRPDLQDLHLRIAKAEADRDLADNQTLPELNLVVEGASSLSDTPYKDREDLELFVGGELKLPLQRRGAYGRLQQATAKLNGLRIEQRFARDRIVQQIRDTRSAITAAKKQADDAGENVELAQQLVTAEQRAFDLGRSDLLRVQLREVQLADSRVLDIDARLGQLLAGADYRAALGYSGSE